MSIPERSEEPHDRLTRLCDLAIRALETSSEYREDDKMIIFIDDEDAGGLVLHGYEDDTEAIAAILGHLKAVFEVNGMTLMLMPIGGDQ